MPQDVHEIEWDLVYQPVLSHLSPSSSTLAMHIEPGASTTLPIRVRGKAGCTAARITVEYGHVDREALQHQAITGKNAKFHVRTIEIPFSLTVHRLSFVKTCRLLPCERPRLPS